MQVLSAAQYGALDKKYRRPNARVQVKRNYDSIPFVGKSIQSTLTSEKYVKHILHSDGRLVMVYSKYNSGTTKWDLYYKSTNITRTVWNTSVKIAGDSSYDYLNPAIIDINSSTNLGIVVSRNGTDLFSCIISVAGVIHSALVDTNINGTTPSLTKISTTYWMTYEASGIIYYETSTNFATWSGATNLNTITGLSNDHYNPYIYYDTSNTLWVTFERVSDAASNPVVKNVYTMLSDDDGSTWDSPVAQTTLLAGDGSALNPSIVDTTGFRFMNYTLEQQIQNYQEPALGATGTQRDFVVDEVQNRVGMLTGQNYSGGSNLTIYDRDTDTYTNHDLKVRMTAGSCNCLAYDEVNKLWAIGTSNDGIIIYDEDTTTWTNYDKTTTPAINGVNILGTQIMAFEDGKLYFLSFDLSSIKIQMIDTDSNTVTDLKTVTGLNNAYKVETYLSASYIVNIIRGNNIWSFRTESPTVTVFDKSSKAELYTEKMMLTGDYKSRSSYDSATHPNWWYSKFAFDDVNNYIYTLATDTTETDDSGFARVPIGASALGATKYYSQVDANPTGLFPNPDPVANKVAFVGDITFNSTNNRLYIWQGATLHASSSVSDYLIHVFNADTEVIIESYAATNTDAWLANWASLDATLIKVLQLKQYPYLSVTVNSKTNTDDKEIIYGYDTGSGNRYFWAILTTEGTANRMYYRKTADDIVWNPATFLTTSAKDSLGNLGYSDSRLKLFWNRKTSAGVYELRWDEDLSTAIDVSEYVESFSVDETDEHSSNKATVILSDSVGLFDPLNYKSLYYDYFAENNIITIEKGNDGEYNNAFTGLIGSGESSYKRGEQIVYRLDCWDNSKNFFKKKVTSILFENQSVATIVDYIAGTYMGLATGKYDTLPNITNIVPTVQFIDEYLMDILFKLYQPYGYFPMFDESGNLVAKEYNYDASTDFTYYKDGTDTVASNKAPAMNVINFDYEWTDKELVNQVTVIGETEAVEETTFPEEFMGSIQGVAGWFSKSNNFTFWFSTDKTLYAEEPRLEVTDSCGNQFFGGGESLSPAGSGKQLYCTVTQTVSNLIAVLYVLVAAALVWSVLFGTGIGAVVTANPLAPIVAMAISIIGQIGNFYYNIYAKPVGDAIPDTIEAVAEDSDLQNKYGIVPMEIDNPLLSTYELCLNLANNELAKAKWFRYIPTVKVVANIAHQIGDVIEVYNPHTDDTYKLFITDIERSYKRGEADVDTLRGGLIT